MWLEERTLGAPGAMTGHSTEDWREAHTKDICRPLSEMGNPLPGQKHRRDMALLRHRLAHSRQGEAIAIIQEKDDGGKSQSNHFPPV